MGYASAAVWGVVGAAALATVAPGPALADGAPSRSDAPAGAQASGAQAPAGNNGTIKIDEFAMDSGQDNDARVGCGFTVSFFGYDAGSHTATVTLTPWAPTSGGHPGTFGTTWSTATRTGGDQYDASLQISG